MATEKQQREGQTVPALKPSGNGDAEWKVKVEKALEARRQGALLRKGELKSFKEIVGKC
ncbi:MAG: hypothetical protein FWE94_05125 [Coriobacteriia bacterium]|nr:hypothetical protein [Coriobacteriia bacterium]